MIRLPLAALVLACGLHLIAAHAEAQDQQAAPEARIRSKSVGVQHLDRIGTGQPQRSDEGLVLITHAERDPAKRREFGVLFGSLCDTNGRLCGGAPECDCTLGEGVFRNDDPEWEITSGYALIRGYRPRIRTSRTTAAAEGTTFFVQIDRSGGREIHRVALVEGGPLALYEVVNNDPGHPDRLEQLTPVTILKYPGTFAEVTEGAGGRTVIGPATSLPPADDGSAGAGLRNMVQTVMASDAAQALR